MTFKYGYSPIVIKVSSIFKLAMSTCTFVLLWETNKECESANRSMFITYSAVCVTPSLCIDSSALQCTTKRAADRSPTAAIPLRSIPPTPATRSKLAHSEHFASPRPKQSAKLRTSTLCLCDRVHFYENACTASAAVFCFFTPSSLLFMFQFDA